MSFFKNAIFKPSTKLEIIHEIFWPVFRQQSRRLAGTNAFHSNSRATKGSEVEQEATKRNETSQQQYSISDTITLNDNVKIPRFGLGVYDDINGKLTRQAVLWALECGYRQIDTAERYKNEENVGKAIRESGVKREDVFIVTKVYYTNQGYHESRRAFERSLSQLGVDYVDLYLIHFPTPGRVVETWKTMTELREKGLVRSIGVSNFNIHHLEALKLHTNITPSINQIEVHPYLQESSLVDYCKKNGIVIQAYSPLTRGQKLNDPILNTLANEYGKSPAQLLLRWSIQKGFVCIPKSFDNERIKENSKVFEFTIEEKDMEILDSLDEGLRTGRDRILQPWNG